MLRLCVVDPTDRPVAGVKLAIERRGTDTTGPQRLGLGTSDAAGMVMVAHVQERLRASKTTQLALPQACRIVPDVPGLAHAGVDVDLARVPDEPVFVRLPGTGQVVVETWCGARPLTVQFRAALRETGQDPRAATSAWGRGGAAHFPHVSLGARYVAEATVHGMRMLPHEGAGPQRQDETVTIKIVLPPEQPIVRARMVDHSGAPWAERTVQAALQVGRERVEHVESTDADGVLHLVLNHSYSGKELRGVQWLAVERGRPTGEMAHSQAQRPLPEGTLDLGDVVLAEGPLVAAGTLVGDPGGAAAADLQVRPAAEALSRRPSLPVAWQHAGSSFTVRGFVAEEDLRLVSGAHEFGPVDLHFRRGATDLRVGLRRHATLALVLRHDLPATAVRTLRVEAVAHGPAEKARSGGAFAALAEDRAQPQRRPVLAPAQLRLQKGSPGATPDIAGERGTVALPLGARAVHGVLSVAGYRDVPVNDLDGDRTVTLEPSMEVRARLEPRLALPAGVELHAFVFLPGTAASDPDSPGFALPDPGCFLFRVPGAGIYRFKFRLTAEADARSVPLIATPAQAAVAESIQEVSFDVEAAEVQRAVAQLGR